MGGVLKKVVLLVRYSAVGIAAFIFELGMLYILLHYSSAPYYVSVAIAFVASITVQYAATHIWVFEESGRRLTAEFLFFSIILITGLMLTEGLVILFVNVLLVNAVVARTLSGTFTGLWDFYINARFNFRSRSFNKL
jgi:putative flippase GtrA